MEQIINTYELLFILPSTMDVKAQETYVPKITKMIETAKGKIIKNEPWGKKIFSYPIKKQTEGFYYLLTFSLSTSEVVTFEKKIKLEEQIVRYLLTKGEYSRLTRPSGD